jgi:ABC-type glycerol-3-phosphate transport system permease component
MKSSQKLSQENTGKLSKKGPVKKSAEEYKWKIANVIFAIVKYASLIAASLVAIVPVVVCVLTAFKTNEEYASTSVLSLPASFTYLENFKVALEKANMLRCFVNTGIVLVVVLTCSIMISAMIAYVLNRFTFPGRAMIENLFLFASLLPGIAMQVTIYKIMYYLGFINHIYGYVVVLMGTDIISIYIFLQFFENLPTSLDESAIMDGCTYFGVFYRILFPLLKPAIMTSMVLKGVSVYNEYYASSLYLTQPNLKTISTALYTFTGPYGNQYNYICAGVLITIIPILALFLIFQKQVYSGMTAGAVKG